MAKNTIIFGGSRNVKIVSGAARGIRTLDILNHNQAL